jgi:urease accessory protein
VPATRRAEQPARTGEIERRWDARLALAFERTGERSVMTHREHHGPLVVQKPLYPEGPGVCQCVIVHPPAGIAGGDRLSLDVAVGRDAFVQLTTPGATKWYRSEELQASQVLRVRVDEGATFEWLPQGTIVYDGAIAASEVRIDLAATSTFIAAEVVSLGRRAAGERFRCGQWRQRFDIAREGALIWSERGVLDPTAGLIASPVGLNGAPVFGTFVAVGPRIDDTMIAALRDIAPAQGEAAITRLPELLVARYRGGSIEAGSAYFASMWSALRTTLTSRAALRPRIWST